MFVTINTTTGIINAYRHVIARAFSTCNIPRHERVCRLAEHILVIGYYTLNTAEESCKQKI